MHAVLVGFAAVAPRSALPNLIEILGTLLTKANDTGGSGGATHWMSEILMSVRHHYCSYHFCFVCNHLFYFRMTLCQAKQDLKLKRNSSKLWQGESFESRHSFFFCLNMYIHDLDLVLSRRLEKQRSNLHLLRVVWRGLILGILHCPCRASGHC